MPRIPFGKTNLTIEQIAFGVLPAQRCTKPEAVHLLQKALDNGMDFFDTARGYTDSEEKLGMAFHDRWDKVVLASKTHGRNTENFWDELETSLRTLKREYIDVYQFHNVPFCPKPGDGTGLYEAMLEAKAQGKIRFIGITNHRIAVAEEAVASGLYDTLQFPISYLSTPRELALIDACKEKGMPLIAMKALSGGLITDAGAACAYLLQWGNLVPIWGIQRETELDEFIGYIKDRPALTPERRAVIDRDREALAGEFCRGCGYCCPCPAGIEIYTCARASLLLRRAPLRNILSEQGQAMMHKIKGCLHCNRCSAKCPYGLDTPRLLEENYKDFLEVIAGKAI